MRRVLVMVLGRTVAVVVTAVGALILIGTVATLIEVTERHISSVGSEVVVITVDNTVVAVVVVVVVVVVAVASFLVNCL
jgi:hypothetical protein